MTAPGIARLEAHSCSQTLSKVLLPGLAARQGGRRALRGAAPACLAIPGLKGYGVTAAHWSAVQVLYQS